MEIYIFLAVIMAKPASMTFMPFPLPAAAGLQSWRLPIRDDLLVLAIVMCQLFTALPFTYLGDLTVPQGPMISLDLTLPPCRGGKLYPDRDDHRRNDIRMRLRCMETPCIVLVDTMGRTSKFTGLCAVADLKDATSSQLTS